MSEVAGLIVNEDECAERHLILHKRNGPLQTIKSTHQSYDQLSYPVLFPNGAPGWYPELHSGTKKITLMDYVKYYLQSRENGKLYNLI